jgi:lysophospholipase L1-like esterase
MSPPPLAKLTEFADMFEGAPEKSRQLARYYQQHADLRGCSFFDAGTLIRCSDADGIHFEPQEHQKLGERVAQLVREVV